MRRVEFASWPKTPRLNRDVIVTEKIDGSNGAVIVIPLSEIDHIRHNDGRVGLFDQTYGVPAQGIVVGDFVVAAQSRNRLVTPGKQTDNYGFARWVHDNAERLAKLLGPGYHYGEWWGSGIARGYGKTGGERFFSLFNTNRPDGEGLHLVPGLRVVPVLAHLGRPDSELFAAILENLVTLGSNLDRGTRPEGIMIYHTASKQIYKVLADNDELPKGLVA